MLAGTSFLPLACGRNDGALFDTGLGDARDGVASLDHSAIPTDAGAAGGAAGATPVTAPPIAGGASGTAPPAGANGGAASFVDEAPGTGGAPGTNVPGERRDAGPPASDAAPGADGEARPCMDGIWYADRDGDGYGRSSAPVSGCRPSSPPSDGGDWGALGGDCNDDDATVHPNQTTYFGNPYTTSSGESSYDYDCSGAEDGDPSLNVDPACAAQTLLTCAGDGYTPTSRTGHNAFCGSTVKTTCALAGFGCAATTTFADTPYGCR